VRGPFLSESEGFRFVLLTVAAFTVIAAASLVFGAWVGIPVWAAVTGGALLFYARRDMQQRPVATAPALGRRQGERRILVIALAELDRRVLGLIRPASAVQPVQVLVVHPAPVSSVHRWLSDVDAARARAGRALDGSLALLREQGIAARGEVGDEDPLQAIEDALRTFAADEILMWIRPESADGIEVEHARERFALRIGNAQSDAPASRG
jgi:hypothetical protein